MLCARMQSQVARMSEKGKKAEKEGKPVQVCIAETSRLHREAWQVDHGGCMSAERCWGIVQQNKVQGA